MGHNRNVNKFRCKFINSAWQMSYILIKGRFVDRSHWPSKNWHLSWRTQRFLWSHLQYKCKNFMQLFSKDLGCWFVEILARLVCKHRIWVAQWSTCALCRWFIKLYSSFTRHFLLVLPERIMSACHLFLCVWWGGNTKDYFLITKLTKF